MTHHHHTLAPSGQGTVMLNIGGRIGALIIDTPPQWHGREIEVSPVDDPGVRTHAAVRARYVRGGVTYCVVLDALTEGRYLIWQDEATAVAEVDVRGGQVTTYSWALAEVPVLV